MSEREVNLLKFEKLFIESLEIKDEINNTNSLLLKSNLYKNYMEVVSDYASIYFQYFYKRGLYENFLKKDIESYNTLDYSFYKNSFSKDFISIYNKSERLPLYKELIISYKTEDDLTDLFLSLTDMLISKNWHNSYDLMDIFYQYDSKNALSFMVFIIEEINKDEDKYEGDLFLNAIAFCVDKINKTDIYYDRLERVLELTTNDNIRKSLSYYLNQVNN